MDHVELLQAVPIDSAMPEPFLAHARPALALLRVGSALGSGFLVSDRLICPGLSGQ
ncbi:MAG: hypothetical protein ACRDTT_01590 [Pseudonocardiaceae bacterium]